jgi:urease accessory protein
VVNKVDLAPYVDVNLDRMLEEARQVRGGRPVIATNLRGAVGVEEVADAISAAVLFRV